MPLGAPSTYPAVPPNKKVPDVMAYPAKQILKQNYVETQLKYFVNYV